MCVRIRYLSFSFWLTSLCIIDSRFIHLIRTDSNAFLFMADLLRFLSDISFLLWKPPGIFLTSPETVIPNSYCFCSGGWRYSHKVPLILCLTLIRKTWLSHVCAKPADNSTLGRVYFIFPLEHLGVCLSCGISSDSIGRNQRGLLGANLEPAEIPGN